MDTTKKIQVVDRDERLVVRTMSGGVAEPLDPAHYPALQNKGSPRVMSRLSGSFKETLLADEPADDAEARAHDLSPSIAAAGLGTSGNGTNSTSAVSVSPRIAARRALLGVPEDSPVPERTLKVATGQVTHLKADPILLAWDPQRELVPRALVVSSAFMDS